MPALTRRGRRLGGLALIAGGVLAVLLIVLQPPNPFGFKRSYWAQMRSVQGLSATGRTIRVAGVNVGEIGAVKRVGGGAKIELILHKDIVVHTDARVDMRPHLLFEGSSFVDLHPGSPSAAALAPDATIPLAQTSNYVTLDEALRILRPRIRKDFAALTTAASGALRGQAVSGLQRTLRTAPDLTAHLEGVARAAQGPHRRELVATVQGTARAVDALAAKERDLGPLVRRLAQTADGLAVDDGRPLDAGLAQLPGALRALDDGAPVLTRTIDQLDHFSAKAAPALPVLARALGTARPVLTRAIPIMRGATPVVVDARRILTALGKADALTEMLKLIPEPLGALDGVLKQLLATGQSGAPVYRELGGAFAGFGGVFRSYQTPGQAAGSQGHVLRANATVAPNVALTGFDALGHAPRALVQPDKVPTSVPCKLVQLLSPRAADQLRAAGGCR